jgi:pimeloyl-ACP methyl ester carboxylesterase
MNQPSTGPLLDATTNGTVDFGEWQTWFRITGGLGSGTPPMVVAHGGPGGTHDYLLTIADLSRLGCPVVHYDQLGIEMSIRWFRSLTATPLQRGPSTASPKSC